MLVQTYPAIVTKTPLPDGWVQVVTHLSMRGGTVMRHEFTLNPGIPADLIDDTIIGEIEEYYGLVYDDTIVQGPKCCLFTFTWGNLAEPLPYWMNL